MIVHSTSACTVYVGRNKLAASEEMSKVTSLAHIVSGEACLPPGWYCTNLLRLIVAHAPQACPLARYAYLPLQRSEAGSAGGVPQEVAHQEEGMKTSDFYRVKKIPERFNHPGQVSCPGLFGQVPNVSDTPPQTGLRGTMPNPSTRSMPHLPMSMGKN